MVFGGLLRIASSYSASFFTGSHAPDPYVRIGMMVNSISCHTHVYSIECFLACSTNIFWVVPFIVPFNISTFASRCLFCLSDTLVYSIYMLGLWFGFSVLFLVWIHFGGPIVTWLVVSSIFYAAFARCIPCLCIHLRFLLLFSTGCMFVLCSSLRLMLFTL